VNTDALESFAAGRPAKAKEVWTPPTPASFHAPEAPGVRYVLGVDQSLSACGLVLIGAQRQAERLVLGVMTAQKIVTEAAESKGFEEHYRRAVQLHDRIQEFLVSVYLGTEGDIELAHEAPPVGGGRLRTPESAILAGLAVRLAAAKDWITIGPMVPPQVHKDFTCGNRRADKKEHHAALTALAAGLGIERWDLITNEAMRDAASVALTHLSREPS
jgi:hypothetical protein